LAGRGTGVFLEGATIFNKILSAKLDLNLNI